MLINGHVFDDMVSALNKCLDALNYDEYPELVDEIREVISNAEEHVETVLNE